MAKLSEYIKTMPYLLALNQITQPESDSGISPKTLETLANVLKQQQLNLVLPIACLGEREEEYRLLTGLPIYEAAQAAGLKEIWVFLVAMTPADASPLLEQVAVLSKLNETVLAPSDYANFVAFLNAPNSDLTSLRGIGERTAEKIIGNRPYRDFADVQDKLGTKRVLNWGRAYKYRKP
jgi:hypothetical protein